MRPDKDHYFMMIAKVVSTRATCLRRSVGCVLVDAKGRVLSTGYNGVASGQHHCNEANSEGVFDQACPAAHNKSGTNLDGCLAIHAEQNALLQCRDVDKIHKAYCTTQPCITCTKLLMGTGCSIIVYDEPYPHSDAMDFWKHAGRSIYQVHVKNSIINIKTE